jgi:hypothetical protein
VPTPGVWIVTSISFQRMHHVGDIAVVPAHHDKGVGIDRVLAQVVREGAIGLIGVSVIDLQVNAEGRRKQYRVGGRDGRQPSAIAP